MADPVLPTTGLKNTGNSCYINTVIQLLRHTYPLNHYFSKNSWKIFLKDIKSSNSTEITKQFGELLGCFIRTSKRDKSCTISPNQFIMIIKQIAFTNVTTFADGNHHDISDFMQFILDNIHMALSIPVTMSTSGVPKNREDEMMIESYKTFRNHYESKYSIIIEIMGGQFYQRIQTCDDSPGLPFKQSETYDPYTILQLPIPTLHRKICNLYDCLNLFIKKEIIHDWKPSETDPPRLAQKTMLLWSLPEILTIQLKRFVGFQLKDNQQIEIVMELDLSNYCHGYDRKKSKYKLFGVGNHIGNLNVGHYTSDCYNFLTNTWHHYDDDSVTQITPNQLNFRHAYILMYQRI